MFLIEVVQGHVDKEYYDLNILKVVLNGDLIGFLFDVSIIAIVID